MTREDKLIEQLKNGDISVFELLIKRYKVRVYKLILSFIKDPKEAEDLTQEVFLKVYESISKFRRNSSFYTWLYRISVNMALSYLRKRKRELEFVDNMFFDHLVDLDKEVENRELIETVFKIAESLPKKEKLIFILKFQNGFSNKEISEILKISRDSVKSNLYHALKRIRKHLRIKGFLGD